MLALEAALASCYTSSCKLSQVKIHALLSGQMQIEAKLGTKSYHSLARQIIVALLLYLEEKKKMTMTLVGIVSCWSLNDCRLFSTFKDLGFCTSLYAAIGNYDGGHTFLLCEVRHRHVCGHFAPGPDSLNR